MLDVRGHGHVVAQTQHDVLQLTIGARVDRLTLEAECVAQEIDRGPRVPVGDERGNGRHAAKLGGCRRCMSAIPGPRDGWPAQADQSDPLASALLLGAAPKDSHESFRTTAPILKRTRSQTTLATTMTTISLISAIAVVVSIGGILPQIVAMLRARSSAGQSALGWCLGVVVNGLLGYVNAEGAQSVVLTAGNAIGFLLSATALALVVRYRMGHPPGSLGRLEPGAAVSTLLDPARAPLVELGTEELEALHGAVTHARATRQRGTASGCRSAEADRRAGRRAASTPEPALR